MLHTSTRPKHNRNRGPLMSEKTIPQSPTYKQEPVGAFKPIGSLAAKLVAEAKKAQAAK